MTRETEISKRIAELERFYEALSEEKMALAHPLIENMVFIEFQMKDLQQIITEDGCTDEYQNGSNQFGKKQSATVQAYNSLVKSYNMINTRLEGMLPAKQSKSKLNELMNE